MPGAPGGQPGSSGGNAGLRPIDPWPLDRSRKSLPPFKVPSILDIRRYILQNRELTPESVNAVESVLRTELLDALPKFMANACVRHGYCTAELINCNVLWMASPLDVDLGELSDPVCILGHTLSSLKVWEAL